MKEVGRGGMEWLPGGRYKVGNANSCSESRYRVGNPTRSGTRL